MAGSAARPAVSLAVIVNECLPVARPLTLTKTVPVIGSMRMPVRGTTVPSASVAVTLVASRSSPVTDVRKVTSKVADPVADPALDAT